MDAPTRRLELGARMSGIAAPRATRPVGRGRAAEVARTVDAPDARRLLQLSLAGLWLLDGVLQFQPYMFTKRFAAQVIAPTAHGNPALVAAPITSVAHLVAQHSVGANGVFAAAQLLLGLGIAWRPTVKVALAASIIWALSVWWLGEGLGGILTRHAGPVAGGPGAALLYAVLAVLLWPPAAAADAGFVASGRLGATRARVTWLVLWLALAAFAVQGVNRSAQGLHDTIANMAIGQPAWLAAIGNSAARLVAHRGLPVSIALAIILAAIALGVFGPPLLTRATIVVAVALSTVIWVAAEGLGGLFGGHGTDPNTGPLLVVLALVYWPLTSGGDQPSASPAPQDGAAC
jgi:hypothetical protein